MPELPEVEIVRRGLLKKIPGEIIEKIIIHRPQSIAYPKPQKFVSQLPGHKIIDITRRGKYIIIHLQQTKNGKSNAYLVIHLRMSGRILIAEKKEKISQKTKFLRVEIFFESKKQILFDDMRVFGRLWYVSEADKLMKVIPGLASLGIEPLDNLDGKQLLSIFKNKKQGIKAALLDQRLLAGIGNIYADEILFQSRIHPLTPAGKITSVQSKRLAEIIPLTLNKAIKLGGSSIKDFIDSDGVIGTYQDESFVYGRYRKPCRICKTEIMRIKITGRSAHFCPKCQSN